MSKQGKYLDIFLLFAIWRGYLCFAVCGIGSKTLIERSSWSLLSAVLVSFQEVAASEEQGRLTLACDWSIVIIEASDWSEVWVAPGSLIIQVIVVGSRPQRESSWWRMMIILSLSITDWATSASTGAMQMTLTRLSNSSSGLPLSCYSTWNGEGRRRISGRHSSYQKVRWPRLFGRKYFEAIER